MHLVNFNELVIDTLKLFEAQFAQARVRVDAVLDARRVAE
jgi:hypothetical protein